MSECEEKLKNYSSCIYTIPLITNPTNEEIRKKQCIDFFEARKPGSSENYNHDEDFELCKTQITYARDKYKKNIPDKCKNNIPDKCKNILAGTGGMRKRRKSRRTKRKRKTLNKNKRTKRKRKTLKKSRRTRRH